MRAAFLFTVIDLILYCTRYRPSTTDPPPTTCCEQCGDSSRTPFSPYTHIHTHTLGQTHKTYTGARTYGHERSREHTHTHTHTLRYLFLSLCHSFCVCVCVSLSLSVSVCLSPPLSLSPERESESERDSCLCLSVCLSVCLSLSLSLSAVYYAAPQFSRAGNTWTCRQTMRPGDSQGPA